jgi:hypothetical protein
VKEIERERERERVRRKGREKIIKKKTLCSVNSE